MNKRRRYTTVLLAVTTLALIGSGCSSRGTPAPVEELYTGKTYRDFEANSLNAKTYQVQRGETLYSIAFRANQDVKTIARINNLSEPYTIYPGQTLRLSVDRAQQRASQSVAQTKAHNDTRENLKKDITEPVAKPQQKEYGQKVDVRKKVAKQTTRPKTETSATTEKIAIKPIQRRQAVNVDSKDIQWHWPSTGQIIASFSTAERGNKGLDFAGQRGDPVTAAAAGKVVYVGDALRAFGQLIILKHNDDYITAYAHNDKILVKEQDWVDVGEVIAEMGDSGTQRVKLHFEVRYRGKSVNPRHYLPKTR